MPQQTSLALTYEQIDQLDAFLDSLDDAMGLEEIDGFFCALIAGPELVMPSEYLPYVFGGDIPEFNTEEQASGILGLLYRHWCHIARTLLQDEVYLPILFEAEAGNCLANYWANGFMLGVQLRKKSWSALINDEGNGDFMLPVMTLHFEHDDDPELGLEPISRDEQERLIADMVRSTLEIYRYFKPDRLQGVGQPVHREQPKVGTNPPCHCGSGRKYKDCHGAVTLH